MAIANQLLAGSANVTIDGVAYLLQGELNWSANTVERESLTGMDGYHGVKETPVASFMEFTLRDASNIEVALFQDMVGSTVVAQLASGKVVIGRNMATVGRQEVNSVEGTFRVRLEGPLVEED